MNSEFGKQLKSLRRARGVTATQFARTLGISLPYLSQLESGRAVPSEELARLIAKTLHRPAREFVLLARNPKTETTTPAHGAPRETHSSREPIAERKPMIRLMAQNPEMLPITVAAHDSTNAKNKANSAQVPPERTTLADTFDLVRPSIVAFASRLVRTAPGGRPLFPEILGTGFIVDSDGIAVTNDHVIEALQKLPPHPVTGTSSAIAIICANPELVGDGHALPVLFVEIKGTSRITSFKSQGPYYGEDTPDIGFVQLNVRGLSALPLADWRYAQRQGTEVATAGFPLGTDPLVPYGKVSQLTPFLRRGIISSVLPFPCPHPHGFTMDIMSQGGASGSPVFLTDRPSVVGMVHAGMKDTNLTYAIPSALIRDALSACTNGSPLDLAEVPTLEVLVAEMPRSDELRWDSFRGLATWPAPS